MRIRLTDATQQDIEAQQAEAASVPPPPSSKPASSVISRGGRGGAGNFVDNTPATRQQEHDAAAAASTTVKVNPSQRGLSGRGGAGNWKASSAVPADEEKAGLGEELERKVLEAVDQGLKMPEKAHHAVEKKKAP